MHHTYCIVVWMLKTGQFYISAMSERYITKKAFCSTMNVYVCLVCVCVCVCVCARVCVTSPVESVCKVSISYFISTSNCSNSTYLSDIAHHTPWWNYPQQLLNHQLFWSLVYFHYHKMTYSNEVT